MAIDLADGQLGSEPALRRPPNSRPYPAAHMQRTCVRGQRVESTRSKPLTQIPRRGARALEIEIYFDGWGLEGADCSPVFVGGVFAHPCWVEAGEETLHRCRW